MRPRARAEALRWRLRRPLRKTTFRVLQDTPGVTGKFFAIDAGLETFASPMPSRFGSGDDPATMDVPPPELWAGYGPDVAGYLSSGEADVERMLSLLSRDGWDVRSDFRVLDFGCAAGRMTRWIPPRVGRGETWGVDIAAAAIRWAAEHLSPPARFSTVTTLPHLPFPDGYFDVLLAGSVFTHIADLEDSWLLELRRVLRPGGRAYFTILDKHALELVIAAAGTKAAGANLGNAIVNSDEATRLSKTDFATFVLNRSLSAVNVFHDIRYVESAWSRFYDIKEIEQEAYGYQTAVVLENPSR